MTIIEKNFPIPAPVNTGKPRVRYTKDGRIKGTDRAVYLRQLEVGDSFLTGDHQSQKHRISNSISQYRKTKHGRGKTFTARWNGTQFRVWRVT